VNFSIIINTKPLKKYTILNNISYDYLQYMINMLTEVLKMCDDSGVKLV